MPSNSHSPTNSLKTSLIEMQQIRQGKLKKQTWGELKAKLTLITAKATLLPVENGMSLPVKNGMIELDPNNPRHKEWWEENP